MTDSFLAVLSNIAKAALPYSCIFSLASPQNDELGYTFIEKRKGSNKPIAHIILNPAHKLLKKLSEIEQYMFSFGVAIHEMLHQKFTDFDYFEEKYKEVKNSEKNLFSIIDNIFEDSRIESLGNLCFGGWALKCLDFAVKTTWELSENFSSQKEYQQIITALIQFGDTGKIKGTFQTSEAADTFHFIAKNYFIPAIRKADGAESTDLALEAARYLLSVYPDAKCIRAKQRHHTIGHGETVLIKTEKDSPSLLKEDTLNSTLLQVANGDYTKGSEKCPLDTYEWEEEFENEILQAAEILQNKINKAEEQRNSEITCKHETIEHLNVTNDPEVTGINIIHVRTGANDIDKYNRFNSIHNCSGYGIDLASDLSIIFKSKNEGWERSSKGCLNVERYFKTDFTSPLVFDKKLSKANDVAIAMLIDCSGSMEHGHRIETVKAFSACCAEAFNMLAVPFSIYGYNSIESSIDFRIYKDFDDRQWCNITSMCADGENVDGTSIRTAGIFLKKRNEENKVLIVLSDGETHNVSNTEQAVREAMQFSTVCGVALAPNKSEEIRQMFGENCITCERINDLPDKLTEKFKELAVMW